MQGFMRDTCGIHVSAVVPGYIEDTCGIHQGYIMRDMYLKGDQDTYRIHPRYIVRYIVRYMYLKCIRR